MLWERPAMSGSSASAARIAAPMRLSAGVGRMASAVSLQGVRAHLQRRDRDGDGQVAQERSLARPGAGDDRWRQPRQGGRTLRRPSDHGLSLAASVPECSSARQAADVAGNCGSGRNLHPRIVQGPALRSGRARPASAAARRDIRAPFPTTSPFSWPATVPAPRPTPSCPRTRPCASPRRSRAPCRRQTCWSATAGGLCALSPDAPKFPSASFPPRESRCPANPTSTSTTSMPTIASQGVDAPLPRRRDPQPAQLSGLAPRSRSLRRTSQSAELDQGRNRKRPVPTGIAIRAYRNIPLSRNFAVPKASKGSLSHRLTLVTY